MTLCQEDLDKFRAADRAYTEALEAAAERKQARDAAVLALTRKGTVREVAAATGLSPGRVQQIATRARG